MSFLRGLLAGRSHLAFFVGIGAALLTIRFAGHVVPLAAAPVYASGATWARELPLRAHRPLTEGERALAREAWSYLRNNTDARTGLTSSVAGYPSITMWDLGAQLMATLAAEEVQIISPREASGLLATALTSLAALDLVDGLPNKAYDTHTLRMVGYDNVPVSGGIGWSALDVGRIAVALTAITERHPELAGLVRRAVGRWQMDALGDGTALVGTTRLPDGRLEKNQEGRFGYEQYAAKALLPFGVPVGLALDYRAHVTFALVSGDKVPSDDRSPEAHGGTPNAVLSEPWVIDGLEHGLDALTLPHARSVLAAQQRRFAATGKLTAVSEDQLDHPPGFAYSVVLNGDAAWTAYWPDGRPAPQDLTFSTKAAIGWWAQFAGDYADRLYAAAAELVEPGQGFWAGRYDRTGAVNRVLSLNTNAVVLEAFAYRAHGPLLRAGSLAAVEARR